MIPICKTGKECSWEELPFVCMPAQYKTGAKGQCFRDAVRVAVDHYRGDGSINLPGKIFHRVPVIVSRICPPNQVQAGEPGCLVVKKLDMGVCHEFLEYAVGSSQVVVAKDSVCPFFGTPFLLSNSASDLAHADRERCQKTFDHFLENHDACIAAIRNTKTKIPRSFGFRAA